MKKCTKQELGITLIALIVTIVVLIILASISVGALTGEDGIINQAKNGKDTTEIANEKEILEKATISAIGKDRYGNIGQGELQEELNKEVSAGKTEVTDVGDSFEVEFKDSHRYYKVDKEGNVEQIQNIVKDGKPGDITKSSNGQDLDGEEKPFEIWCIEDLIEWSQNYSVYKSKNIKLCQTLNFKSKLSYANSESTSYGDINKDGKVEKIILEMQSGIGFTPIAEFSGDFDGQEFELRNIYINVTGNAGLFAKSCGTVQNLGITGNIVSTENNAGGIVGSSMTTTLIINCYNLASITAQNYAGGILGYQYVGARSFINCYNSGKIQGNSAGGIIGGTTEGEAYIYNCYNIGDITGTEFCGGIMGYQYHNTTTEIKNCYNYGNISGSNTSYVKEIIGFMWGVPIIDNVYYFNNKDNAFGGYNSPDGTFTYYEDITDSNLIINLNSYIENRADLTKEWRKWKKGENSYPIFE